jgi:hypothetical protein
MSLRLGKLPAVDDPRDLLFADVRPHGVALPKIPKPGGGYGMDFGASGWGMLGNGPQDDSSIDPSWAAAEGAGNCEIAGPCHDIMEGQKNSGHPVSRFTCLSAIKDYTKFLQSVQPGHAYDPQSGANDTGCNTQQVLSWRQKVGITDANGTVHKIGPYFRVKAGDFGEMWDALWLAECIGIGIEPFPQSAMDQFNAGQPWEPVKGSPASEGHWVIIVGHPTENVWTGISWGRRQLIVPAFITEYVTECWAWIDPERFTAVTGKDVHGFTAADVQRYLAVTAQQVAAQFG